MDWMGLGNYGANVLFGAAPSPDALRAMTEDEMRERDLRMWPAMRSAEPSIEMMRRMQNVAIVRRPTMTLAEWDARRAAFRS